MLALWHQQRGRERRWWIHLSRTRGNCLSITTLITSSIQSEIYAGMDCTFGLSSKPCCLWSRSVKCNRDLTLVSNRDHVFSMSPDSIEYSPPNAAALSTRTSTNIPFSWSEVHRAVDSPRFPTSQGRGRNSVWPNSWESFAAVSFKTCWRRPVRITLDADACAKPRAIQDPIPADDPVIRIVFPD